MSEPIAKCRSCAADVVWLRVQGKDRPQIFDARPETMGVPNPDGTYSYKQAYRSHFVSCPNAEEWKKKNKEGNR